MHDTQRIDVMPYATQNENDWHLLYPACLLYRVLLLYVNTVECNISYQGERI